MSASDLINLIDNWDGNTLILKSKETLKMYHAKNTVLEAENIILVNEIQREWGNKREKIKQRGERGE